MSETEENVGAEMVNKEEERRRISIFPFAISFDMYRSQSIDQVFQIVFDV